MYAFAQKIHNLHISKPGREGAIVCTTLMGQAIIDGLISLTCRAARRLLVRPERSARLAKASCLATEHSYGLDNKYAFGSQASIFTLSSVVCFKNLPLVGN